MALVKVLRSGQVTLPASVREQLQVKQGDYLEAEVRDGELILKRAAVADRKAAFDKMMEIVNRPKWRGPGPEPSDDELMEMVVEDIHAMRRENGQSGSR